MRLHWIGHASFLLEAEGCRILVDACLGGADDIYDLDRQRRVQTERLPDLDLLVVTSRRAGRFDVPSLATLPRDVEVLLPDDPALADCLTSLGYSRLSPCRPFEERTVGSTRLAITPSSSANECGLLIADGSGVLWSIADLLVDESVVDETRARWPAIDVLLAAWRPRARGGALDSPELQLGRYRQHLATVARIQPRSLVPWGVAPRRGRVGPAPPRLDVPVSRERFVLDSGPLLARFEGRVSLLDPGDVLEVERDAARVVQGGCPFVDRAEAQERDQPATPPAAEALAGGAEHPLLGIVTREVEEELATSLRRGIDSSFADYRRVPVVYQLEVVLGHERLLWSFDFGAAEDGVATVGLRRGADPLANFVTTIDAEDLLGLAQGRRDWSAVVAAGGYGGAQACYRATGDGLERLAELADPLAFCYDAERSFLAAKGREIEAERARWASILLGRLGLAGPREEARGAGPPIPLFVTEEHHEAFLVWHAALRQGLLPPRGNVLLHVDEHSDMRAPRFHRPLPELDADLGEIERFTYEELDIESFIAAACLQGLFARVEWLQRDEQPAAWRFSVSSLRGERKVLRLRKQIPGGVEQPGEGPWLTWRMRRLDGPGPELPGPEAGLVLGIDLDYFSCDDALNHHATLEITAGELESFRGNPYHALRLGNRFQSRVENGRCFLDYNSHDEQLQSSHRVTEEEIAERVRSLVQFLSRHRVRPHVIHVTRSRHSGFTPADQWQRIEELLLGGLHSLYDLRVIPIDDLRRQVEPHENGNRTAGAPAKMQSATLPVVSGAAFPSHLDFPGGRILLIPTGCNNRCSFCMVDEFIETNDHHGRPRGEAPLSAELRALIEELPRGHRIDFFGAEPTLHESFFSLLQAAAERDLRITLASNGRVFSSPAYTRRVAALASPQQMQVRTSILGATAEVHDGISGSRGSFDQMLKGVRHLVETGYDVHFNMVLTRENVHQAADTARVGIDHGAKSMKISGLIDVARNAGSFVPYQEAAEAVEAFCSVCEERDVPYALEKLPLCVAPRRMHHFVFEQGVYAPDRGVMTGPGQPCRHCVVRNFCYGVEPAFLAAFGADSLRTVHALPEEVRTPLKQILEGRAEPPFYRVAFTRVADPDLPLQAWAELLRFKERCEREVGDLCVERVGANDRSPLDGIAISFPPGVYADARVEHEIAAVVRWRDGELVDAGCHQRRGAFVRVRRGGGWNAAATTDLGAISDLLADLARREPPGVAGAPAPELPVATCHGDHRRFHGARCVAAVPLAEKAALLQSSLAPLRREDVPSWSASYQDRYTEKRFLSSLGADLRHDAQDTGLQFRFVTVAGEQSVRERFSRAGASLASLHGAGADLEGHLERCALFVRGAQPVRPGRYTVVLSPAVAGIFAHETVGHRAEADFQLDDDTLRRGWRLGDRVGPADLSILDDGSLEGSGYVPWDDDGQPASRTWLVRDGVLAGRLHSASTAAVFGERPTGNARALDFRFEPLVRMTTTWIAAGALPREELLSAVEEGYYIETVAHGSGMSTFTMAPVLAWRIEGGRVAAPARITVASGDVLETLSRIDGLSDAVEIPWMVGGGCGKLDQGPLQVAAGGPFVRIRGLDLA